MKGCSQFLALFVLAALVGFLIYNQSQVNKMKEQVSDLSSRFKIGKNASSAKKDIVTPIIGAKKHAIQAKSLLKKGDNKAAQKEIDKVIESLDTADSVSRDIIGEIGSFAGVARDKLVAAYQQAKKDITIQIKSQDKSDKKDDKKR